MHMGMRLPIQIVTRFYFIFHVKKTVIEMAAYNQILMKTQGEQAQHFYYDDSKPYPKLSSMYLIGNRYIPRKCDQWYCQFQ